MCGLHVWGKVRFRNVIEYSNLRGLLRKSCVPTEILSTLRPAVGRVLMPTSFQSLQKPAKPLQRMLSEVLASSGGALLSDSSEAASSSVLPSGHKQNRDRRPNWTCNLWTLAFMSEGSFTHEASLHT